MSEQTPDTENGMAEGQDPSMEDILASIRKIIAEDDVQAPIEAETLIAEVVPDAPGLAGDISELGHVETLDLDIMSEEPAPEIDTDIEALIGDMDATASDSMAPSLDSVASPEHESLEDILDLEIPMDETESLAAIETPEALSDIDLVETETLTLEDELIDLVAEPKQDVPAPVSENESKAGLMGGALAAMGLAGTAAIAKADEVTSVVELDEEDDLSLMLDNMLEDSSSYEEASRDFADERVVDPAEDLIAEGVDGDDILAELDFIEDMPEAPEGISKSDPDIDLVKSLMADLTETPLHDDAELVDDVAENSVLDDNDEFDASSDDIMDEILSITIDDETKLSEELAIPEINAPFVEDTPHESLSLKDIAAAAEADAQTSESGLPANLVAGLSAAAIGGVAAVTLQDEAPGIEALELEAPEIENLEIETLELEALELETLEIETQNIETLEDDKDDVDMALSQLETLLADEDPAELDDLIPETFTHESITEETPPMARAKKTDAIIDEVTETATAGAFASLTNVVEEKATVAERGDRIGDLVMEALQPMLKEWLDANLKGIVERAVTKEVKRISSGK